MTQNDAQVLDAHQMKLLAEAAQIMVLPQNVSAAPNTPAPAGWKLLASSDPNDAQRAEGFFAKVYERTGPIAPGEPKYAVAFRGTDKLSDLSDLKADTEIAFRKIPKQYWQALEFVERVCAENKIDPREMEFTGHSLGGYLAITVGTTLGAKNIWTFNAPGPTQKIKDELSREIPGVSAAPGRGLVQIRSIYDIISAWGIHEGTVIGLKTTGGPHGIASLGAAMNETLTGRPQVAVGVPKKHSLTAIFEAVSRRIALSPAARSEISHLMHNDPSQQAAFRKPPSTGARPAGQKPT